MRCGSMSLVKQMSHDEALLFLDSLDRDPANIPTNVRASQERAWRTLINRATNRPADADGNLDPAQYYVDMVAVRGTAFGIWALRHFIAGVDEVYVKSKPNDNQRKHLVWSDNSIWNSEKKLNSFLKRLGRALEKSGPKDPNAKRPVYPPDWDKNVNKIERLIVQGWCQKLHGHGYNWPILCALTIPAIFKFLSLCNPPIVAHSDSVPALRQKIWRLGLISMPGRRIRSIKRQASGDILFG
jgi:hypothetical protein